MGPALRLGWDRFACLRRQIEDRRRSRLARRSLPEFETPGRSLALNISQFAEQRVRAGGVAGFQY
jgi:hypothetical protein